MNAIELLKADHDDLRALFQSYKTSGGGRWEQQNIFEEIKEKLEVHTHIEETVFYPLLLDTRGLEDVTGEMIEKHHVGDALVLEISEISGFPGDGERFDAKMKALIESMERHLREEEEVLFPEVIDIFTASELGELGRRMREERKGLRKSKVIAKGSG